MKWMRASLILIIALSTNLSAHALDNASYVALSRQAALFRQMDVIANNVANANTPSFKSDRQLFVEYPVKKFGMGQAISFANDVATIRNSKAGAISLTHRFLDIALDGEGYFQVQTPFGVAYTRDGSLIIDQTGQLVTAKGYPILTADGNPITFLVEDTDIQFRGNGLVTVQNNQERGRIGVVAFADERQMIKLGEGLYKTEQPVQPAQNFQIVQGALEQSNVNAIAEMTKMIEVTRSVSSTSNLMNSIHELQLSAIRTIASQRN